MLSNNPKLNELMKRAKAAFNALTREEQRAHRREQAISWVFGEMMLSRAEHGEPELTKEEEEVERKKIADMYDDRNGP